jgi:hypothetical protein
MNITDALALEFANHYSMSPLTQKDLDNFKRNKEKRDWEVVEVMGLGGQLAEATVYNPIYLDLKHDFYKLSFLHDRCL